jgi:uncharacterized protein (DUF58 family)
VALLDAAFVRELEALKRRLEIRARSAGAGEHAARRKGSSAEFQEHRAYAPGDDLRRIDWAAYARTGEPVLKLFRAEEDVILRIVCDTSASMAGASTSSPDAPSKLDVARKMAAALGYLALLRGERAQLMVAGEGISKEHLPVRGRGGLVGLFKSLELLAPDGRTDLAKALDTVVRRSSRPGMLVVLSDFFDDGAVLSALSRAVAAGHDVALVQVLAPEEEEPDFEGDLALEDVETGAVVEVSLDPSALEAYVLRFAGLCEELRGFAKSRGAVYVRVRTDDPLDEAVRRFVSRSTSG